VRPQSGLIVGRKESDRKAQEKPSQTPPCGGGQGDPRGGWRQTLPALPDPTPRRTAANTGTACAPGPSISRGAQPYWTDVAAALGDSFDVALPTCAGQIGSGGVTRGNPRQVPPFTIMPPRRPRRAGGGPEKRLAAGPPQPCRFPFIGVFRMNDFVAGHAVSG